MGVYVGCCGSYVNPHENIGGECVSCHNKRIKNKRKMEEEKEMGNPLEKFKCEHDGTVVKINNGMWVSEEDYLKVVEELESTKDYITYHTVNKNDYLKVVEEKEELKSLYNSTYKGYSDLKQFNDKLKKELEELEVYYEQEKELRKTTEENLHRVQDHLQSKVHEFETLKIIKDEKFMEILEHEKTIENCVKTIDTKNKVNNDLREVIINLRKELETKLEAIGYLADFAKKLKEENEIKEKELTGLDIRCESLEEENEGLRNDLSYKDNFYKGLKEENEKMKEHIEVLTNLLKENEEPMEDTYTLIYGWVDDKGNKREYKQEGLLMEDFTEMFGMDSDNWEYHVLVKETE